MKTRLKIILLNQYIGAIAIGLIVARAIEVFVGAFMPAFNALITQWLTGTDMGRQYWSETIRGSMISNLFLTALFLLIAYIFAAWLYAKPVVESEGNMEDTDSSVEENDQP